MAVPFVSDFDDLAEAMAVPNPNRPIQEAVASFGRQVCDSISARPDLYAPTILQSPLVAACKPYWDNQGYDSPVPVPAPFSGGQCTVLYNLAVIRDFNGSTAGTSPSPLTGPITGFTQTEVGPGPSGTTEVLATFSTASGSSSVSLFLPPATPTVTPLISRVDGLPDDCGDPPPGDEFEPGDNPAPDPGPLPPGTGPTINIRGGVILVPPGAIQISPDITFELSPGEINLGSGTGGGPSEPPLPGEEAEGAGSGEGGGENDFGEPPEGERWVGCCIRVTETPIGSGVIPSSIPHDVYPIIIGNARLRFQGPGGPPEYDTPIQKRQETSCLWEPVRGLAPVGVFVNLLPGYSYVYTAYSVPLEQ